MGGNARRGRWVVIGVILATALSELALAGAALQAGRFRGGQVDRVLLTGWLLWRVWDGAGWARWVTAGLFLAAAGLAAGLAVASPAAGGGPSWWPCWPRSGRGVWRSAPDWRRRAWGRTRPRGGATSQSDPGHRRTAAAPADLPFKLPAPPTKVKFTIGSEGIDVRNRSFPRWAGPLVGVCVGAYLPLRRGVLGGPVEWGVVAVGAGCGLLAGFVTSLADAPPADTSRVSTVGGELLAAIGWAVVLIPGVNVVVNAAAARVNRGVRDWPGRWSRVALGSSVLLSILCAGLLVG